MQGRNIILYDKTQTGVDGFNRPIYTESPTVVENVLIGLPTPQEVIDTLNLTGKRVVYTLGIPKGDLHTWTDRLVELPAVGQEELIPLAWGKNVMVEKYE